MGSVIVALRQNSVQFSLSACPTLCDLMVCSTPGFPVLHCVPELAQTHVHRVSDAIQPSRPLSSPSLISCLQSFPTSGPFPMSQFFTSGGQSIGLSASTSVLPIQCWFHLRLTGLISLLSKRLSTVFSYSWKASILRCSAVFMVQVSHPYMTTGKTIALTMDLCRQVMSLLFNVLSRFVIAFLPRSKCLNFMAAVTVHGDFGAQENKICSYFHFPPIYLPWSDGTRCHGLSF